MKQLFDGATPRTFEKLRLCVALVLSVLLEGCWAEADMSNAFHENTMSSGAIATGMDSCISGAKKGDAKMDLKVIEPYCSCVVDWLESRPKELKEGYLPPIPAQKKCLAEAQKKQTYPLRNSLHPEKLAADTVWQFMNRCQNHVDEGIKKLKDTKLPKNLSLFQCSCFSDYFRDHVKEASGSVPDSVNHTCSQWALKYAK